MGNSSHDFTLSFQVAIGRDPKPGPGSHAPYPYQIRLALERVASRVIHAPTGCGKTAAAILAWLWQRKVDPGKTPCRLVYCLPMRAFMGRASECVLRGTVHERHG